MNPLYKNYAVFAQSEAVNTKYLPYVLIWNNYYLRDNVPSNPVFQYETYFFNKIQTAIYNENIKALNEPYIAVYAKGLNAHSSFGLNHNDRMSFVYYNYGDFIIDELGYPGCQLLLSNKDILVDGYFNFSQKKNLGFYTFSDLLNSKYRLLRGIQEEIQNCYEQYQEETYVRKFLKSEKWNTYRYLYREDKGRILFFNHCISIHAQSSTGREDGYGRTDVVLFIYGIVF